MVSEVGARQPALARLFTDTSTLPDLLCMPPDEWCDFLHGRGARLDHVEDADLPSDDFVYEQMALDARQFVERVGVFADGAATDAGAVIARIGQTPFGSRTEAQARMLQYDLRHQIRQCYRGDQERRVVTFLQNAAQDASRVPGPWKGYLPGLLLAEVRHLLMLANADAAGAQRFVERMVGVRLRLANTAGLPRADRTRMDNINAYGHVINAYHMRAITQLERTGTPSVTITEARATWILLTDARLLFDVDILGSVHCLGSRPEWGRHLMPKFLKQAPIILKNGSQWRHGPVEPGVTATLMMYLMNHEFDANEQLVFPSLGIDMESRRRAGNVYGGDPRAIARHRHANKALAMELLTALLLAQLNAAYEVRCHSETRDGQPHKHAPAGLPDVEALYLQPPPGFYVMVAASAKEDVTREHYREQLEQALDHGRTFAGANGLPVYAMVLNGGNIADDEGLADTFADFAHTHDLRADAPVRVLPMWAPSMACALGDLVAKLPPAAVRFESAKLEQALDDLVARALRNEDEDRDWGRNGLSGAVVGAPAGPQPSNRPDGPEPG